MPIKVCWYNVSELSDPILFNKGMTDLIWKERAERVHRFRFDKDKRLCLGAGLLAADMLKKSGADHIMIGTLENGKPYLMEHDDIHFNISHDGEYAVCAVADSPVGADIQQISGYEAGVANMTMQSDEIRYIEASSDRDRAFTRLWTRKESFIKLIGTGLSYDMRRFCALPDVKHDDVFFSEYTLENYLICICCRKETNILFSEWRYSSQA